MSGISCSAVYVMDSVQVSGVIAQDLSFGGRLGVCSIVSMASAADEFEIGRIVLDERALEQRVLRELSGFGPSNSRCDMHLRTWTA